MSLWFSISFCHLLQDIPCIFSLISKLKIEAGALGDPMGEIKKKKKKMGEAIPVLVSEMCDVTCHRDFSS